MPDANPPPTGLAARSRVLCSVLTHLMAHPVSCTRIRGLCTTGAAGEPIIERRRTRRCRDTACAGCVWGSPWGRFRRGELDFLLLACSVARQLADSALWRPAGSPLVARSLTRFAIRSGQSHPGLYTQPKPAQPGCGLRATAIARSDYPAAAGESAPSVTIPPTYLIYIYIYIFF